MNPGHRIGHDRIAERRVTRLQEIMRRVLSRIYVGISEAHVDEDAIGAGNRRHDTIEDFSVGFVLVEAEIDEVAKIPSGLRRSSGIDALDVQATFGVYERICVVSPVSCVISQKGCKISR